MEYTVENETTGAVNEVDATSPHHAVKILHTAFKETGECVYRATDEYDVSHMIRVTASNQYIDF